MLELPAGNSRGGTTQVQWYYRLGLGRRLAFGSAALSALIVAALLSVADTRTERNHAADASNAIIAAQLANGAAEFIINGDRLALQALMSEVTRFPTVTFAAVRDPDQRTLVESGTANLEGREFTTYRHPCKLGDGAVGSVEIQVQQTDFRQFNPTHIALLSGVVFILNASLLLFYLHGLDATLRLAIRRLRELAPATAGGSPLALLRTLSGNTAQRYGPLAEGRPASALALRLPALAEGFPGTRPNPLRLADIVGQVTQIAEQHLGRVSGRQDGWLIEFRGDDTAARALRCAATLRDALDSESWQLDWSITVDREALRDDSAKPALRALQWQRSCDQLYRQTADLEGLLLTRLALSDPAINHCVQVCEEDGDLYRVTQIRNAGKPVQPAGAPGGCTPRVA